MLITSKGLTNGTLPASAVLFGDRVARSFQSQDAVLTHAETQAGGSVPCAAVSATVAEMHRLDAVVRAGSLGTALAAAMSVLVREHARAASSTGTGCFRTLGIVDDAGAPIGGAEVARVVAAVRAAGAIVHPAPGGISLVPALTWSAAELDELMSCVRTGLDAWLSAPPVEAGRRS